MAENNLVEMAAIRKRQVIGEIIKNTESCCLVWSKTLQSRQFSASTKIGTLRIIPKTLPDEQREYEFYISQINSGIYLDVLVNCKRFVTYDSDSFPDVITLYQTIEGIWDRKTNNLGEAVQTLQNVPPQCGILFTEYTRGGVVVGGGSESELNYKMREGGIVVGGHAPYNQRAIPEGGAIVGGEAVVTPYIELPEGGIVVGGVAEVDFKLETKGGVLAGGSALFETAIELSGGVTVGGTASVRKNVDIIGSGGVIISHSQYLWMSTYESLSNLVDTKLQYTNKSGSTLTTFQIPPTLDTFALDPENKRVFWSDGAFIHRTSQLDPSDDVTIYPLSGALLQNMDYDKGRLAFSYGGNIIITDDNGTVINSLSGGATSLAIDVEANLLFLARNLGSDSGLRIIKYDLETLTEISRHPQSFSTSSEKMELDRESQELFYGLRAGVLQANMRIFKLNYDFTSETTIFPIDGLVSGQTLGIAVDQNTKDLFVWYRSEGNHTLARMNYDGSDKTTLIEDVKGYGSFVTWLEVNPVDFAIVEHLKSL